MLPFWCELEWCRLVGAVLPWSSQAEVTVSGIYEDVVPPVAPSNTVDRKEPQSWYETWLSFLWPSHTSSLPQHTSKHLTHTDQHTTNTGQYTTNTAQHSPEAPLNTGSEGGRDITTTRQIRLASFMFFCGFVSDNFGVLYFFDYFCSIVFSCILSLITCFVFIEEHM